tara:strand:+ start:1300 stop:1539 length:240 start_codon:yes stop_codon:yes gene_type:complete
MADKYTKVAAAAVESPAADAWKDLAVEKEVQPPKVKSNLTYRQLEQQVANLDTQAADIASRKSEVEAEMAKVKTAAEKE